jgi:uncharacterized protein
MKGISSWFIVWCGIFLLGLPLFAQPTKILHYTETSGYDHQTRSSSFAMFQQMGIEHGFTVDNDSTGQSFNSLSNLQQYNVVVFSNTTGDAILDATQKQNFEQYMSSNGAVVGIHSASDTYRHSTANGSNTGSWDWFAEMLGASVQQNPSHVSGTPVYRIDVIIPHPLLFAVPAPWYKAEEYYYWESGYFNSSNIVLQKVEQTIGPNSLVNSYDSARAVTWYRILSGGRVFYTSLGHAVSNYTSDTSFYRLLSNAILWAGDSTANVNTLTGTIQWSVFPNPSHDKVIITSSNPFEAFEMRIYNLMGEEFEYDELKTGTKEISIKAFPAGIYSIRLQNSSKSASLKFVKE